MLAVKGIFDGKSVKLLEKQIPAEPQEVIVTFLGYEADKMNQEIYALAEKGKSFDFLNGEDELYADAQKVLSKVKKRAKVPGWDAAN